MYYILFYTKTEQIWTTVYGEDAMNVLVNEICNKHHLDPDEIIVIHEITENQLEYID